MTSIFYIEKEKFLRSMMEHLCKTKGINVYTIDSSEDCLYLIEDLTPNLIVIDLSSTAGNLASFLDSLKATGLNATLVATGIEKDWEDLGEMREQFAGYEPKPLVADGLLERLTRHLA